MQAETGWAPAQPSTSTVEKLLHRPRLHAVPVRIAAWVVLLLCALAQAWWTRHIIFRDGISYLDIATKYARGDWRSALNEYWSPLISWFLAAGFRLFLPSAYWQVAMLHVVNLAAFALSLLFLELFVGELLRYRGPSKEGLSDQTIRIGAYAGVFIAGLWHITMGYVSPDMITMAILFLLAWLQLRIERGRAGSFAFVLFGIGLAFGFLSRAAFAMSYLYILAPCWSSFALAVAGF